MGGEGDDRGWNGWMASPIRWTWVWVSSGSWWWIGKTGVLQSMGLQRVGHDWATELNWTEHLHICVFSCQFDGHMIYIQYFTPCNVPFGNRYSVVWPPPRSRYRTPPPPQMFPLPFGAILWSEIPGKHWSIFCPWNFAFPEWHINEVRQCVAFWLLILGVRSSRPIQVAVGLKCVPFYCREASHHTEICVSLFIHPLIKILQYFQVLAAMNRRTINIHV